MKMRLFTPLLLLFSLFNTYAPAQNSTKITGEFVPKVFRMNQVPEGMTEQKIKSMLANHTHLVAVNECSFNTSNGNLKLSINNAASLVEVLKIFYHHGCPLTFTDSDGIEKKYDPKPDKIVPVN